jgi:Domain of unknown function (DUF4375)
MNDPNEDALDSDEVDMNNFIVIAEHLASDPDAPEAFLWLSHHAQVVFISKVAEMEIQNGGYLQLFWNHPELALRAADMFDELGANEAAALTQRAIEVARDNSGSLANTRGTLRQFAEAASEVSFAEFDSAFYDLTEDLIQRRLAYTEKHPEVLISPT